MSLQGFQRNIVTHFLTDLNNGFFSFSELCYIQFLILYINIYNIHLCAEFIYFDIVQIFQEKVVTLITLKHLNIQNPGTYLTRK